MLPAIVTPITAPNALASPEKPETPPNSDTSEHSHNLRKRGMFQTNSPDGVHSSFEPDVSAGLVEHESLPNHAANTNHERNAHRPMRDDLAMNAGHGLHSRDRSLQRKLPPTMLDMYLPKTTGIVYKSAESSRGKSPMASVPARPQSMIQMRASDPNYSRATMKSRGLGLDNSGVPSDSLDFDSSAYKSRTNHMVKYNSDKKGRKKKASNSHSAPTFIHNKAVEYEIRLAEVVNKITKKPSNSPPDMELLQNILDLLNEFYRFAGPLEGLLVQLQTYVTRCVFSQRRCPSRCCTESNAPYFEHVRHMENERDYVREEYQEIEQKSIKKNEYITQLQDEIAELKGNCEFKEQEIRLQRKIFDKEQEKDVNRTMNLYADVEAAENECEGYRIRVVELIDIITRISRKVKELEYKRALNGDKREEIKVDFSEDWQRLGELQTKFLDHVPKSVLKETQTELNQKKEALSVLKSKYFVLHTAHKKLKTSFSESVDRIHELEKKIQSMKESMTPRPDLKPLVTALGDLGDKLSTSDALTVVVKKVTSLKSSVKEGSSASMDEKEEEKNKDGESIDLDSGLNPSRRTPTPENYGSRQIAPTISVVKKYHANLGISEKVPIFLRSSFSSTRNELRPIGKNALDAIIKEIFSKRLEELRALYGNFRSLNREEKYAAGSKLLKSRVSFPDFMYAFLKSRYNTGATEWARNILSASEMHKSDPVCLIFYKIATQSICEDAYFEMQNLIFYLRETLNKMEKSTPKKGMQASMITMDDIMYGIQETFPSKGEDDINAIKQLLIHQYNEGHVTCDNLFGDVLGKPSLFVEILQDQYILDMEEFLFNIEQGLEAGASELGVSPTQAAAVIQTIDPEAPLEVVKNSVAVGFQVTTTELDTHPIAPVDVYSFMKRLKQIMVRRFTKPERHRR